MTADGYISDMEEIFTVSWPLFEHDDVAVFELAESSAVPPAMPTKNLPGEQTLILNVRWFRIVNRHPVKSDENLAPGNFLDTENWLNWNIDLYNLIDSEDNCVADIEWGIMQENGIEESQCQEKWDVSAIAKCWIIDFSNMEVEEVA